MAAADPRAGRPATVPLRQWLGSTRGCTTSASGAAWPTPRHSKSCATCSRRPHCRNLRHPTDHGRRRSGREERNTRMNPELTTPAWIRPDLSAEAADYGPDAFMTASPYASPSGDDLDTCYRSPGFRVYADHEDVGLMTTQEMRYLMVGLIGTANICSISGGVVVPIRDGIDLPWVTPSCRRAPCSVARPERGRCGHWSAAWPCTADGVPRPSDCSMSSICRSRSVNSIARRRNWCATAQRRCSSCARRSSRSMLFTISALFAIIRPRRRGPRRQRVPG